MINSKNIESIKFSSGVFVYNNTNQEPEKSDCTFESIDLVLMDEILRIKEDTIGLDISIDITKSYIEEHDDWDYDVIFCLGDGQMRDSDAKLIENSKFKMEVIPQDVNSEMWMIYPLFANSNEENKECHSYLNINLIVTYKSE